MSTARSAQSTDAAFEVPPDRRPKHIAIIMDGNGRWALDRNLDRADGHRAGAQAARKVVEECGALSIETLTLYSFSMENWKRPASEVDALMGLLIEYLPRERDDLISNNVRFQVIGSREGLDADVIEEIDQTTEATAGCTGLHLILAINYGSRFEITMAARRMAEAVREGTLDPSDITEETLAANLWTAGIPDPDLLIRTAGEQRVSNYLLWQISYAEIHVSRKFWPDFDEECLRSAIIDFASRKRRYGALDETNS